MGRGGCDGDILRSRRHIISPVANLLPFTDSARYHLSDVAKHNSEQDCWVVVKNKVYNVTEFAKEHPGGRVIYTHAGKDATDAFSVFHAPSTWTVLQQYCIGSYVQDVSTPELLSDFRDLRADLVRQGVYASSKPFYVYKSLTTFAIVLAAWAVASASSSWGAVFLSAALLGLFQQQIGWLAHDILHHQLFKCRTLNTLFGGYFLGNVVQGFSFSWWTDKHNTHHAAPNECDEQYGAVDPDIDTVPFLAWSRDILATVKSPAVRGLLRWQAELFLPILLFARFAWLHSSWLYVRNPASVMKTRQRAVETALLVLHYGWTAGLAFGTLSPLKAVCQMLLAEVAGGLFLGIVFVQSHNGMEVYNDHKDFYSAQIVSTRDIKSSLFNNWFSGGLNRQIEHHLFPTIPRHNLHRVTQPVMDLCTKHGLVFEDVGMGKGTSLVLKRLAEVAAAA